MNLKSTSWTSPSNIALIKYWGKIDNQIPINPSISFTLKESLTKTKITFEESTDFEYEFFFDGVKKDDFRPKLNTFFERTKSFFPSLNSLKLKIESSNTFPHSSGIASSASAFSALTLCLLDNEVKDSSYDKEFFLRASQISRLGSGSASRSLFGPISVWGKTSEIQNSSDENAVVLDDMPIDFPKFYDSILLVDEGEKKVSSSAGHELMRNHRFKSSRILQSKINFKNLIKSINEKDLGLFIKIVEDEALTLHALMMTSNPSFILFKPNTIEIINRIREFRNNNQVDMCFTLDAGANVHLLYPEGSRIKVIDFIENELLKFCKSNKYIDDSVGMGPSKIH